MRKRFGAEAGGKLDALPYGERREIGGVGLRFLPAGNVLGSAPEVLEWQGCRVCLSGDSKRRPAHTCAPENGRASGRPREWQTTYLSVANHSIQKKTTTHKLT